MNFVEKQSTLIGRQTIYDNTKASKQVNIPLFSVDMDSIKAEFERTLLSNSKVFSMENIKLNPKKKENPHESNPKFLGWFTSISDLNDVKEEYIETDLYTQLFNKIYSMYEKYIDDIAKRAANDIKLSVAALNHVLCHQYRINEEAVNEAISAPALTDIFVSTRELEKALKPSGIKRLELLRIYDNADQKPEAKDKLD